MRQQQQRVARLKGVERALPLGAKMVEGLAGGVGQLMEPVVGRMIWVMQLVMTGAVLWLMGKEA